MTIKLDSEKIFRWEFLGILFIFIIFGIFDFYPQWKKADKLKEKISMAEATRSTIPQTEIERQTKKIKQQLIQMKEDLKLIQEATLEVKNKVVQEKNIPLITREIVDIAALSQIELTAVKPLEITVNDGYEILPIDIRFQCNYHDLIKFLIQIEASLLLVGVEGLSINKNELIYPKLDIHLTTCTLFAAEGRLSDSSLKE